MKYTSRYLEDREVQKQWLDPRLPLVRVDDLRAYLDRKGWKPVTADRPHVFVYEEPSVGEEGPFYQFVPDSEQRRDYTARVYELLAAVALVEGRWAGDVLTDVLRGAGHEGPNGAPQAPLSSEKVSG
jgi:hypothetical protein